MYDLCGFESQNHKVLPIQARFRQAAHAPLIITIPSDSWVAGNPHTDTDTDPDILMVTKQPRCKVHSLTGSFWGQSDLASGMRVFRPNGLARAPSSDGPGNPENRSWTTEFIGHPQPNPLDASIPVLVISGWCSACWEKKYFKCELQVLRGISNFKAAMLFGEILGCRLIEKFNQISPVFISELRFH